jgi:hypothetical protein
MEEFKEENLYVETDPTGRYGRVSSKILCFLSVFPLFLVTCVILSHSSFSMLFVLHKYVVLQGTCFFLFIFVYMVSVVRYVKQFANMVIRFIKIILNWTVSRSLML